MTKAQATVFSLVLAIGAGTTYFTFKHLLKKEHDTLAVDENGNVQQPVASTPPPVKPTVESKPVVPPTPTPEPSPADLRAELFREPEKLLGAFTDLAKSRDVDAFLELAGPDAIDAETRPRLVELLENPAYEPPAEHPVISLARVGDATRWAIRFQPVEGAAAPVSTPAAANANSSPNTEAAAATPATSAAPATRAADSNATGPVSAAPADPVSPPNSRPGAPTTGAVASPGEGTATTPPATTGAAPAAANPATGPAATAAAPVPASPTAFETRDTGVVLEPGQPALAERLITIDLRQPDKKVKMFEISKILVPAPLNLDPNSTSILPPSTDSVTVAHYFANAVLSGDFKTARALSDPDKITDERIAALMIAVEEGGYTLHDSKPLTQTLERDTVSWIIARVKNANVVSEFGLEMSRLNPESGWRIDSMSFDKIIQMTSAAAGGGGVAYAPIVKNPQGGDSLVLFFDFDGDKLNVRAMRQVEVIASILKTNPARQITINGHADALGLDDYNSKLSARRAAAVKKALTSLGVAVDQVITKGFGETAPRSPNFKADGSDNPSGRSQNRRTEVYLNF